MEGAVFISIPTQLHWWRVMIEEEIENGFRFILFHFATPICLDGWSFDWVAFTASPVSVSVQH